MVGDAMIIVDSPCYVDCSVIILFVPFPPCQMITALSYFFMFSDLMQPLFAQALFIVCHQIRSTMN